MTIETETDSVCELTQELQQNLNHQAKVLTAQEERTNMELMNPHIVTLMIDLSLTDQARRRLGNTPIICTGSAHLSQLERKDLYERDVKLIGSLQSSLAMEELIKRVQDAKPRSITLSNFSPLEWLKASHDESIDLWDCITSCARDIALVDQKSELCTINMANVETKKIDWVWEPYISTGTLTCLDGHAGEGKSTLCARIAADLSVGRALPGQDRTLTGRSLFICNEDAIDSTLKPRLLKMGADCSKIEVYDGMLTLTPQGLTKIQKTLVRLQPKIVFIDPLFSFLKATSDTNSISAINEAITPLRMIAKEANTAIVVLRHLRKTESDGPAIFKGMGSIGVIGGVRSGLMLQTDPREKNQRFLLHIKSNQSAIGRSLQARLDGDGLNWLGFSDVTPESFDKMSLSKAKNPRLNEAISFLQSVLKNGPVAARKIHEEAKDAGISEDTLRRAKDSLSVVVEKNGSNGGQWEWFLVPDDILSAFSRPTIPTSQHAHDPNLTSHTHDPNLAQHASLENKHTTTSNGGADIVNGIADIGGEFSSKGSPNKDMEDGHGRQDQGIGHHRPAQPEGGAHASC
jgi:archaellum biogenesis ATPase FlaH